MKDGSLKMLKKPAFWVGFVFSLLAIFAFYLGVDSIFAFTGPSQNPPSGLGAIGSDASNNISIGTSTTKPETKLLIIASSTDTSNFALKVLQPAQTPVLFVRNDGSLMVATTSVNGSNILTVQGGIYVSGNVTCGGATCLSGTVSAANVLPGLFNSSQSTSTGNFAFPASLGVGTSTTALPTGVGFAVYPTSTFFGNVGLGTTQPSSALHIIGGAIVSGNVTTTNLTISGLGSAGNPCLSVGTTGAVATSTCSGGGSGTVSATGTVNYFPFYTATSTLSATSSIYRLSASGGDLIGIGTSAPTDQLSITGNFSLPIVSNTAGVIKSGGQPFIHNFGDSTNLSNFFAGISAGNLNMSSTAWGNTGVGGATLPGVTSGCCNSALGYEALLSNTTGYNNSAVGVYALSSSTTGFRNSAVGYATLLNITTGSYNAGFGDSALSTNTTGNENLALGNAAGVNNATGSRNVFIGRRAGYYEMGSDKLYIANSSTTSPLIYGDFSVGRLGILTINPSTTLTVAGSIYATGNVSCGGSCGGGGGVGGSGTANAVPLWTASATLGNSIITQSASTTIINPGALAIGTSTTQTAGTIYAAGNITTAGNFLGSIAASNVTAATFGSGNFAFPASLGINTSTAAVPASLTVYGTSQFNATSTLLGTVMVGTSTNPGASTAILINGHEEFTGPAPTFTACGTPGPTLLYGNDHAGAFTMGATTTANFGCTIVFNKPFTNPPACYATDETDYLSLSAYLIPIANATSVTLYNSATSTTGAVIRYGCLGSR